MEDKWNEHSSGLAPELSEVYEEMERTRALHLDVSDVILCSNGCGRREWIQVSKPDESSKL